ncbi:MAG: InlB B-repeat-containing protein, partial [Candidatus Margulisiibacteriota bacterium]
RTGFTFAGWNTKADGSGTVYTQADTFAMGYGNVTLYANWSTHTTYTVNYAANGATSGDVPTDSTNYETGYSVTVQDNTGNLEKTGFTFAGWNTQADGSGITYSFGQEFVMGSANVVLYAKWSSSPTYTVTYNANGATSGIPPIDTNNYESGQTVTVQGNTGNLEKAGYRFVGWNTNAEGSGTTYPPGQTFSMGSDNVNLYAKWETSLCLVDFNSEGGSTVPSQQVFYGEKVSEPNDPSKSGYTFAGWFREASGTTPWYFDRDIVTGNITLYAKWTVNQLTVSFYSNGGTFVAPQTVTYGQKATRPADPTKTGYSFTGWFKNPECTESWVFDLDAVIENITLYAGWNNANHTVTFNSQGGSWVAPQTIPYGGKAAMPSRPTKGNYALAGWYTDASYSTLWVFASDTVVDDMTLYAKWTTYSIGDRGPAGGWVFYDKGSYSNGWRYMEAAPNDLTGAMQWGAATSTYATSSSIGSGTANTDAIMRTYGLYSSYAARSCREVIVGDYSDWIMPSYDELNYMRSNLAKSSIGNFSNGYYWCSTEQNKKNAWIIYFRTSLFDATANKGSLYRVRPARYF